MKKTNVIILMSLVLILSILNASCGKSEIKNVIIEKNTINKIDSSIIVNDSILYQSDFTKPTLKNTLNNSLVIDYYNLMNYSIDSQTFTMTRISAGDSNDKIYNASGVLWKNVIPDSVLVVNFNIDVKFISKDNDYQVDIINPIKNTRTSHYLVNGINNFDFDFYPTKDTYTNFEISTFGKMPYGGIIPYTIIIHNITVKVKKYK